MKTKVLKVGDLETNCYILIKDNKCLIIDPGADYEKIISVIKENQIVGILVTHYHFDHIGALNELQTNYKVLVYDKNNLKEGNNKIENFDFEVIYTPGHSSDSITIYFKDYNILFVGDFIFKENIGRCDLPTGNLSTMMRSIDKIKKYDDNTIIYPGHGDSTSLSYEKANNRYF